MCRRSFSRFPRRFSFAGGARIIVSRDRWGPGNYRRDRAVARLQGRKKTPRGAGAILAREIIMNCRSYEESLLNLDLPDQTPAELQSHLAGCEHCRELQRRLVLLQNSVKQLPLPVALSRLEFL